jgi:hypothetical protein
MSGTQRLPGGERRKASQRRSRPAVPVQPLISRVWHRGDRVRWRDRIGVFRRDVGDSEHAEIVIADRTTECVSGTLPELFSVRHPQLPALASRSYA